MDVHVNKGALHILLLAVATFGQGFNSYSEATFPSKPDTEYDTVYGRGLPYIRRILPDNGPVSGGTPVFLLGDNFFQSTEQMECRFGNTSVIATYDTDGKQLICISPTSMSATPVTLEVTLDSRKHYTSQRLSFTYYEPVITSISPTAGPGYGTTRLTVRARETNFAGAEFACVIGEDNQRVAGSVDETSETLICNIASFPLSDTAYVTQIGIVATTYDGSAPPPSNTTLPFLVFPQPVVSAIEPVSLSSSILPSPSYGGSLVRLSGNNLPLVTGLSAHWIKVGEAVVLARTEGSSLVFQSPSAHDAGAIHTWTYDPSDEEQLTRQQLDMRGVAIANVTVFRLTSGEYEKGIIAMQFAGYPNLDDFSARFHLRTLEERGGMGFSFSVGAIPETKRFGEQGAGSGLRIMVRTHTVKAIEVMYRNRIIGQSTGYSIPSNEWVAVTVTVALNGTLSVCFNGNCAIDELVIEGWRWEAGWGMALAARTTERAQQYLIRNLEVSAGALTIETLVPVSISLNGQHFDPLAINQSDVAIRYFAPPVVSRIGPSGGDMGGNTNLTLTGKFFTDVVLCRFGDHSGDNNSFVVPAHAPSCDAILHQVIDACTNDSVGCFLSGNLSSSCCQAAYEFLNHRCDAPVVDGNATQSFNSTSYPSNVLLNRCGESLEDVFSDRCPRAEYLASVYCTSPPLGNYRGHTPVQLSVNTQDFHPSSKAEFYVYNMSETVSGRIEPISVDAGGGVPIHIYGHQLIPPESGLVPTTVMAFGDNRTRVAAMWDPILEALTLVTPTHPPGPTSLYLSFNSQNFFQIDSLLFTGPSIQTTISPFFSIPTGENLVTVVGEGFALSTVFNQTTCRFGLKSVPATVVSDTELVCLSPDFESAGAGGLFAFTSNFDAITTTTESVNDTLAFTIDYEQPFLTLWRVETAQGVAVTADWGYSDGLFSIRQSADVSVGSAGNARGTYATLIDVFFGLGSLSVEVLVPPSGITGVVFRYLDQHSHYVLEIGGGSPGIRRLKRVWRGTQEVIAENVEAVPSQQWQLVTISCADRQTIKVYWGIDLLFVVDETDALQQGRVGLMTWHTGLAEFSHFVVTPRTVVSSATVDNVELRGLARWDVQETPEIVLTESSLLPSVSSVIVSVLANDPAFLFTAKFEVSMETNGNGVAFFYGEVPPFHKGIFDQGARGTGFSLTMLPSGDITGYWRSQQFFTRRVSYPPGQFMPIEIRFTAVSSDAAFAGRVSIEVLAQGIVLAAPYSLDRVIPRFKPTFSWKFGFGASSAGDVDETEQRVRLMDIGTNFATGIPWPVPVRVSLNNRDAVNIVGDGINRMFYANPIIEAVSPNSVELGSSELVNITTQHLSATTTGVTSYGLQCAFLKKEKPSQVLAVTEGFLAGEFLVQCPASASVEHGENLIQLIISSQTQVFESNTLPFSYFGPRITAVSPRVGPLLGSPAFRVFGDNLDDAQSFTCRFESSTAGVIEFATAIDYETNSLSCPTPPTATEGYVNVTISLNEKDFATPTQFFYHDTPLVTDFSPASCSTNGGCAITVRGSHLSLPIGGGDLRCRVGADIAPGVLVSDTEVTCVAPSFERSVVYTVSNASEIATSGDAVRLPSSAFQASLRWLAQSKSASVDLFANDLRASLSPSPGLHIVTAGPALDSTAHTEVVLSVSTAESLFVGVTSRGPDLTGGALQEGVYAYTAALGNTNGSLVVDGVSLAAESYGGGAGLPADSLVKVTFSYGRLSFEVDGVQLGEAVTGLTDRPYYLVAGKASESGVFDVEITSSRVVADYEILRLTDDAADKKGSVIVAEFSEHHIQYVNFTGDIWIGPAVTRSLDASLSQVGADGMRIQYAHVDRLSSLENFDPYLEVALSTFPIDTVIQFNVYDGSVFSAACTSTVIALRESGWRPMTLHIHANGTVCLALSTYDETCCDLDETVMSVIAAGNNYALGFLAETGDLSDIHAIRQPVSSLIPPRNTSQVSIGLSLNAVDYFDAPDTFRMFGLFDSLINLIEPTSGPLGEDVRVWGFNLFDGTDYHCIFFTDDEAISVAAFYDEPTEFPEYTEYDERFIEAGPVRCRVPVAANWTAPPPTGTVLGFNITLNNQDFINNPDLTFQVYDSFSIVGVSPHSGPVSGETTVNVTLSVDTVLSAASRVVCRFSSLSSGEIVDEIEATAFGGDLIQCVTRAVSTSQAITVTVTINGKTFFGIADGVAVATNTFTFYQAPFITSIAPLQGLTLGGSSLSISGLNLLNGTAGEYLCKFKGRNQTELVSGTLSVDSVTCVSPEWPYAEEVTVHVAPNSQQFDTTPDTDTLFTFYNQPSNITGPQPDFGPSSGGTVFTVQSTDFVIGLDPKCRLTLVEPPGTSVTVDATLNPAIGQITCSTPDMGLPGQATLEVSLFTTDFVLVPQQFLFIENPLLTTLEYHTAINSGGTVVTALADMSAFSLIENPVCEFTEGGRVVSVNAIITTTNITCIAPPLSVFPVNRLVSLECAFSRDLSACDGSDVTHTLYGAAERLNSEGVLQLSPHEETDNAFGSIVVATPDRQLCPLQFVLTGDFSSGAVSGADGVFLAVGSRGVDSLAVFEATHDLLVVWVNFHSARVRVSLDGNVIADIPPLITLPLSRWHHIEVEVIGGILTVSDSGDLLIPSLTLPTDWHDHIVTSSSCQYSAGALSYETFDTFYLDIMSVYGEVVDPPTAVGMILTFNQNFRSNELRLGYSKDPSLLSIFPPAGTVSGGTLLTVACEHVNDDWQVVECIIAGSIAPAVSFGAANRTVECITPEYLGTLHDNGTATVTVSIRVNHQHVFPQFVSEEIFYTFYEPVTIRSYTPVSAPMDGGTTIAFNLTNIDPSLLRSHLVDTVGIGFQCLFDTEIATPTTLVAVFDDGSVNVTCVTPSVRQLVVTPTTVSLLMNDNRNQTDQFIGQLPFAFYELPSGISVSPAAVNVFPTQTTVLLSPINTALATHLVCWTGVVLEDGTAIDSNTVSCPLHNAFDVGTASVLMFNSSKVPSEVDIEADSFTHISGHAAWTSKGIELTPTGEQHTHGSFVAIPPRVAAPWESFHVEFDLTVAHETSGASIDLVGGDGVSFSFGEMDIAKVGESGFGQGIRVLFRTYVTKQIEVFIDGSMTSQVYVGETCNPIFLPNRKRGTWQVEDCTPFNQIRNGTNHVEILWRDGHLTVLFGEVTMADQDVQLPVPVQRDWSFTFGARTGAHGDGHIIDNVVVRTGAAVAVQTTNILVSLNGQQFINADEKLTYLP